MLRNWENILVSPDATLEQAVSVLDQGGQRIVLVVDANRRLLGTLTDGDVRRALLRHLPLTSPVSDVMARDPRTAAPGWNKERTLSVLEKYGLFQLPVVNDNGEVVGMQTLHELLHQRRKDNPVFLMAGGFGTRLRPLTHDCPKPLLKVGGKPILELILETFVNVGFHRFFISTHYMPEKIRAHFGDGSRWGVSIRYIHEDVPLGTGGALGLLPHDEIDLPMFLMNGDLLTNLNFQNLLDFHHDHHGAATMCVREYEYQVPYGVIQCEGHNVRSMVEKPTHRCFINAGIYLLSPELVRSVEPGTRIDMPSLLEQQIAAGNDVTMFPVHEYWLDVGRMEDFQRAQAEVAGVFGH